MRRHNLRQAIALMTTFTFVATGLQALGARAAFAAAGDINTIAGNGSAGYSGDTGPAINAEVNFPQGVALDSSGDLYFADQNNNVIRKVDGSGTITTFAGNGTAGYSGDNGQATQAELNGPSSLAVDPAGDVYLSDLNNNVIRKVDTSGIITTVAGNGTQGYSGDGGPATSAALNVPIEVAVIPGGGFYFADGANNVVRKVDGAGMITTVAGTGTPGYAGDGGPATQAQLNFPIGVALDELGDLYITDASNGAVRSVDPSGTISTFAQVNGMNGGLTYHSGDLFLTTVGDVDTLDPSGHVTVVAGSPTDNFGYGGDGGPATSALMSNPFQVAVDASNDIFIGDSNNARVREVTEAAIPSDLLILRMSGTANPGIGQQITYRVGISNPGTAGPATGVTLTDTLPAGETFVSATTSQGSCTNSGNAVSCPLDGLAAGALAMVTIIATAPNRSTSLTNTAQVTANEVDRLPSDNRATVTTLVDPTDVALSLSAPSTAQVPTPFAYTATVANNGPNDATNTTLTNTLPAGLTISSTTPSQGSCTPTGTTLTCNLGTLAAQGTATVTINVTPTNAGAGVTTDTATVTADQVDPVTTNNSASAQVTISGQGCGMVITHNTSLTSDIGPCAGHGIVVGANGITLNLNHHRVFGLGDGHNYSTDQGFYAGIVLRERFNVTVKNGTVSGFDGGIEVMGGSKDIVTGMTVQGNLGPNWSPQRTTSGGHVDDVLLGDGILVGYSSLDKVTNNVVTHNGPYDGIGVLGFDANSNVVQGNTVKDSVGDGNGNNGQGITVSAAFLLPDGRNSPITHDNVLNNTVSGSAGTGIVIDSDQSATISSNTVSKNGLTANPGNGIEIDVVAGQSPTTADVVKLNKVTGNGQNGILVTTLGNQVTSNTATGNNVTVGGFFDLRDTNAACGTNAWKGNKFGGPSTISPACTA